MPGFTTVPAHANLAQLTKAEWDTYLSDNMNWVGGADGRGTSPPGGVVDGHRYWYLADAANGIVWPLVYRTGGGTWKWECIGPQKMGSQVDPAATTIGAATYTDIASGPTVTVPRTGEYWVEFGWVSKGATYFTLNQIQTLSVKYGAAAYADTDGGEFNVSSVGTPFYAIRLRTLTSGDVLKLGVKSSSGYTTGSGSGMGMFLNIMPRRIS